MASLCWNAPLAQILTVADEARAKEAHEIVGKVRSLLADCAGALSIGHGHGDNHAANTLIAEDVDGGLVAGWFDFDDAGPGYLAYDLATFLWTFLAFTRSRDIGDVSRPLWPAFIEGYRQARPIPDADFAAIGLLVSVRHINFIGQYASRIPEWGAGMVSAEWIGAQFGLVRKWEGLEGARGRCEAGFPHPIAAFTIVWVSACNLGMPSCNMRWIMPTKIRSFSGSTQNQTPLAPSH